MIIGKLMKPYKIVILDAAQNGSEMESYSLLKLSMQQAAQLIDKASELGDAIEYPLDGSVVLTYKSGDGLHTLWKSWAEEKHKEKVSIDPGNKINISAEFESPIDGTSCLVRDPKKHIIRIALRKENNKTSINRVCIPNDIKQRFFYDAKTSTHFAKNNKYAIDTDDLATYTYWSKYMNNSFVNQYKEKRKDIK